MIIGLLWTFSGAGAEVLMRFLLLLALARLLNPEDFGITGAAITIVNLSLIFCQIGIARALIQRSNIEVQHIRTAFTLSLMIGVLVSGIIVLFAAPIAALFAI